ncbi:MAG TPA: PAS domain S-box protein [Sphingobacteriaceae bacterium]|nr:PAS domain S-box protein [Sphingobacteriaceae bacterium]
MLNFDNHFKDLFDHTNDLIHFLSLDGNIQIVNSSWSKHLGYTLDEIEGQSIYDIIAPESRELYQTYRQEIINEGNSDRMVEISFLKKNGKILIGEGQIGRVITKGNQLYTRAVFRDITFQKLREKENEEVRYRLNKFIQYAPDAVIVINENELISEWNYKAEAIFGFSAVEALGQKLDEMIIPLHYREAHRVGMARFLTTGEGPVLNKTIEITALHKYGHEFAISLSISNVNIDGVWVFIAFIADITERKKQEYKVGAQHNRLKEIAQIQSHEIRGPVSSIIGILALMRDNYNGNKEYLVMMETAVKQLDEKIRTIVKYTEDI